VEPSNITKAYNRISSYIVKTPLINSIYDEFNIYLKLENLQKTNSFKARGALNKLLKLKELNKLPKKVIAASAGNHAQGVAYAASLLGIAAKIFMPETTPLVKIMNTQNYGAEVELKGQSFYDAFKHAESYHKKNPDDVFVHAFADQDIIAGQGTLGMEIIEQLPESEKAPQIIIPVGGGGLISGVAIAIKNKYPQADIYGVVSDRLPVLADSFAKKKLLEYSGPQKKSLAEGLTVKNPSQLTFEYIKKNVTNVITVTDEEICTGVTYLLERHKQLIEGSGAAGIAAFMAKKLPLDKSRPVVFVLCGGNLDIQSLNSILERSLHLQGRKAKLRVMVSDSPGGLAEVAKIISLSGGNVLHIHHERHHQKCEVHKTIINFEIECKNNQHLQKIRTAIGDVLL